jgi:hypothetical protein
VNGLRPGQYGVVVARLLRMAEAAGDFPVWGTCQGFQQARRRDARQNTQSHL